MDADVQQCDALPPLLRQDGGITRRDAFVDGLLRRQVGLVHRRDQTFVLLHRSGHQVHVGLDARGDHPARIAMPGVIVHHEILQTGLQHHAVFMKLHTRGALDRARHIAMLDLTLAPHFDGRTAVGPPYGRPAHARDRRFRDRLRLQLRFAHRPQNRFRRRSLVRYPALHPAFRFGFPESDQPQTRRLQNTHHEPGVETSGVQPRRVIRFLFHPFIPWL